MTHTSSRARGPAVVDTVGCALTHMQIARDIHRHHIWLLVCLQLSYRDLDVLGLILRTTETLRTPMHGCEVRKRGRRVQSACG
eukprot:10101207-Alexandrium_andersonii.AAC.1